MSKIDIESRSRLCFCFDRDATVDIGKWPGPIPIEWVEYISNNTNNYVVATGNQKLKEEAGIPGTQEMLKSMPAHISILYRNPSRRERLELARINIDADEYIIVDDVDLSDIEWADYYSPMEFVDSSPDVLENIKSPGTPSEYAIDRE